LQLSQGGGHPWGLDNSNSVRGKEAKNTTACKVGRGELERRTRGGKTKKGELNPEKEIDLNWKKA